jgi:threonine-phosphate decarboxylase
MITGHGGNTWELAARLGCRISDITDMSSNVNPLGPPPGLMAFLTREMDRVLSLPQVDAGAAVAAVAGRYRVDPANVVAGNGSTELIHLLPRALNLKKGLIVGPTYADYGDACRMQGAALDFRLARAEDRFVPDLDAIGRAIAGHDAVFICNPNNPTGAMIPKDDLARLCRSHPETVWIVDESYLPFAGESDADGMVPVRLPNVVVLSSMSKIFRVPGLRIGFAFGPAALMDRCRRLAMPWTQNALAQAAVGYLMDHRGETDEFIRKTRHFLDAERRRMTESLVSMPGLDAFESATSFVLCRVSGNINAGQVCECLARKRILVRNCANFHGLDDTYFRISLKLAEDNRRVVVALDRLFHG